MNICFLGNFSAGGTERVCFALANELSKTEHFQVYLLNTVDRPRTFSLSKRVRYDKISQKSTSGRISLIWYKNQYIKKYVNTHKIDILILVEAMASIFALPLIFSKKKVIVWEHANYFQSQNSRFTKWVRKLLLKKADYYVVLTKKDLSNFTQNEKIRCPIDYIYNIIPELTTCKFSYNENSKRIISVGHLNPIKNFSIIPSVFSKISEKHPSWKWCIYGSGTIIERKKIEEQIANYNLQGKVELMGRCDDLSDVYRNAAILVLTSFKEGLPTVLLEAQAYGVPCVSFDIETGPNEIIENGVNGFLISPYDKDIMSKKILEIIEKPSMKKFLSEGSSIVRTKFDSQIILRKWHKILWYVFTKE